MHSSKNSQSEVTKISFIRRLGPAHCSETSGCPHVFELADGNFAIIGKDVTEQSRADLPSGAGCAPGERIVVVPRHLLVNAKRDIPDNL